MTTATAGDDQVADALTVGAGGEGAIEAAVMLLARCGSWLDREDFVGRFITGCDGGDSTQPASVDWEAAVTALDAGELPCTGGEQRILRLAASLAAGTPVSLSDALPRAGGARRGGQRSQPSRTPQARRGCRTAASASTPTCLPRSTTSCAAARR